MSTNLGNNVTRRVNHSAIIMFNVKDMIQYIRREFTNLLLLSSPFLHLTIVSQSSPLKPSAQAHLNDYLLVFDI